MNQQKIINKFGLFTATMMVIGSLIGVGIFFKNKSIMDTTGGSPTVTLIAWTVSGLIALCAAVSFSEIGTIASGKNGLAMYGEKLVGIKFRNMIATLKPIIYLGILSFILAIFSAEAFFQSLGINEKHIHVIYILLTSAVIFLFFIIVNTFSLKFGGLFQNFSAILKMIPVILVILVPFISPEFSISKSYFNSSCVTAKKSVFSASTLIALMPSILFTFDGFSFVMDFGDNIKKPKKTIPLAVLGGMFFVLIIYLLITTSQLFAREGISPEIINKATGSPIAVKIFWVLLTLGGLGVLNGVTMSSMKNYEYIFQKELLPFTKKLNKKKISLEVKGFIGTLITFIFIWFVIGIPSALMNSDVLIDASSNLPTLFAFLIYLIIIFAHFINRTKITKIYFKSWKIKIKRLEKSKVEFSPINSFIYYLSTMISIIGIIIVLSYQIFQPFIEITNYTKMKFGGFNSNHRKILNWHLILLNFFIILIGVTTCTSSYFYNKNSWIKK
ncbi:MAG: amino acid permease [Mycoplasma sp.]|nr:amino acid permease [Mycoplasma sp.]